MCRLCEKETESWRHIWNECSETSIERQERQNVEGMEEGRLLMAKLLDQRKETRDLLRMTQEEDEQKEESEG